MTVCRPPILTVAYAVHVLEILSHQFAMSVGAQGPSHRPSTDMPASLLELRVRSSALFSPSASSRSISNVAKSIGVEQRLRHLYHVEQSDGIFQ